ncbi:MAG: hypothetical protein ACYTF1_18885 [Planctomycetota bacterium]|jgi:hypothetical protein
MTRKLAIKTVVLLLMGYLGTAVCLGQLPDPHELHIDLGEDTADRITHPQIDDGDTEVVTAGGRLCRKNVTLDDDYNFYFAVDDRVAFQGNQPQLDIVIAYYDTGTGALQLEYDSNTGDDLPAIYKNGGVVSLTGSDTWKQHTFTISDAYFGNRQSAGADFRIAKLDGSYFYLDTVEVTISKSLGSILGSTNVAGDYQFRPERHLVNDGAIEIADAGMRIIKVWCRPAHGGFPSPTVLVQEPYYKELLNRPFDTCLLTVLMAEGFGDGYDAQEQAETIQVFSDLAEYMLETYNGTGKVFILGHHEADWKLRGTTNLDPAYDPGPVRIQGLIDMYNARQQGVTQARAATSHDNVWVYCAGEVNHIKIAMYEGRPTVTSHVLAYTNLDLIAYSCWDTLNGTHNNEETGRTDFRNALEYLASYMPDTGILDRYGRPFGDRNVFIGEYGTGEEKLNNLGRDGAALQERAVRVAVEEAVDFGCPWLFYWQVYCNDCSDPPILYPSQCSGYWLRRPDGTYSNAYTYLRGRIGEQLIPPDDFLPDLIDYQTIELAWNDKANETSYRIERSVNGGPFTFLANVPADSESYRQVGYWPGDVFQYRLRCEGAGYLPTPWFYSEFIEQPSTIIDTPEVPAGAAMAVADESISFTTGGSSCSSGALEYRFEWGDGSYSDWGGGTQSHIWAEAGIYEVRAMARCVAGSESVGLSDSSGAASITIFDTPSDFDFDIDVDQEDFGHLQVCYSGTGTPFEPGCEGANLDGDNDVDLQDFDIFRNCMSGANIPPAPGCME